MVTAIFVVEPITEPTIRVGNKVLKNHHETPERKSKRCKIPAITATATTFTSSTTTAIAAPLTAAATTTVNNRVHGSPNGVRQVRDLPQAQNLEDGQQTAEKNCVPSKPVNNHVIPPVAAAATVAAAPAAVAHVVIKHNLLLGPTLLRHKRMKREKERKDAAAALLQRQIHEQREKEREHENLRRSGIVSNTTNLKKMLARISQSSQKNNICGRDNGIGNDHFSSTSIPLLSVAKKGSQIGSSEVGDERDSVNKAGSMSGSHHVFDIKPRSRWISVSSMVLDRPKYSTMFKYSNLHTTFFDDNHVSTEEERLRFQSLPPPPPPPRRPNISQQPMHQQKQLRRRPAKLPKTRTNTAAPDKNIKKKDEKLVVKRRRGNPKAPKNKSQTASSGTTKKRSLLKVAAGTESATIKKKSSARAKVLSEEQKSKLTKNAPISPQQRHKLAKELLAEFEAEDQGRKRTDDRSHKAAGRHNSSTLSPHHSASVLRNGQHSKPQQPYTIQRNVTDACSATGSDRASETLKSVEMRPRGSPVQSQSDQTNGHNFQSISMKQRLNDPGASVDLSSRQGSPADADHPIDLTASDDDDDDGSNNPQRPSVSELSSQSNSDHQSYGSYENDHPQDLGMSRSHHHEKTVGNGKPITKPTSAFEQVGHHSITRTSAIDGMQMHLPAKVTIRSLLELDAGRASEIDLFYKRSVALDALTAATDIPSMVACLQYVRRLYGGMLVSPIAIRVIEDAESKAFSSMQNILALHMLTPVSQGGLGYTPHDTDRIIRHILPLLGSNFGLDLLDLQLLLRLGIPLVQAAALLPFLQRMENDVFQKAVSLTSRMLQVSAPASDRSTVPARYQ